MDSHSQQRRARSHTASAGPISIMSSPLLPSPDPSQPSGLPELPKTILAPPPVPETPISAAASTTPTDPSNPLSLDHFRLIEEGRARGRRLISASRFAAFNAWSLAIFAVLSALFAITGDYSSLVVGVVLGIFAVNEFRGTAYLKSFDARGPRLLGWNQIALGFALVAYSIYSFFNASTSSLTSMASTGDPELDRQVQSLTSVVKLGLYGTLAAIGVIVPGLTALYYFTRARLIRDMVNNTPAWVIQTLRAAA